MTLRDPRRRAPAAPGSIEAVATATAIIDFLAESEAVVGVQEVAAALGMTKSRISRHLTNLETLGLVTRGSRSRGFALGWRIGRWGQIAAGRTRLPELFRDALTALGDRLAQTVLLSTAAGGDAVVVACVPARAAIRIQVDPGLVLTLPHSPTARVCYAFQPRERRAELLDHARAREDAYRIDDPAGFERAIAAIQARHYAWDNNKFAGGYGAVAAPVFHRDGTLAAVVTVMLPSDDLAVTPPGRELVTALLACAESCGRLLGSRHRYPLPDA